MEWKDIPYHIKVWHGKVRNEKAWHDMARQGNALHGKVRK
jgi:hypothetical protein